MLFRKKKKKSRFQIWFPLRKYTIKNAVFQKKNDLRVHLDKKTITHKE